MHLRLPAELLDQLRAVGQAEDRSVTAEAKRAITQHIKTHDPKEQER